MAQYSQSMTVERQQLEVHIEYADAHCHLNLLDDPHLAIRDSRNKGVSVVITAGGSSKDNEEILKLLVHEHVFAVVGIGPDFAVQDASMVDGIADLVKSSSKIVGIGEIGMDVKVSEKNDISLQKEIFEKQVRIAKEMGMPVVIHSRGALDEVVKVIEKEQLERAMFHFFEGDEEQAAELAKKGYLISIPPAWTGRRKRIIKELNLNNIVVETDSPIVGKTPADVIGVCETIAELKGVTLEEVATKTTENIRRLFYI